MCESLFVTLERELLDRRSFKVLTVSTSWTEGRD
jgi:hypothetical protein